MSVTPVDVKINYKAIMVQKHAFTIDRYFYAFHVFFGGITYAPQPTFCIYDSVNKVTPSSLSWRDTVGDVKPMFL